MKHSIVEPFFLRNLVAHLLLRKLGIKALCQLDLADQLLRLISYDVFNRIDQLFVLANDVFSLLHETAVAPWSAISVLQDLSSILYKSLLHILLHENIKACVSVFFVLQYFSSILSNSLNLLSFEFLNCDTLALLDFSESFFDLLLLNETLILLPRVTLYFKP